MICLVPHKGIQVLIHLADTGVSHGCGLFCLFLEISSACTFRAALQRDAGPVCGIALALWAALLLSLGSCRTLSSCCPRVLRGLCSLTGIEPARGRVYPLLVVLPQEQAALAVPEVSPSPAASLGKLLQLCKGPCCARDPDCTWEECECPFRFCRGKPGLPDTSAECFHSPEDSECCLHVKRARWMCPYKQSMAICL